MNRIFSAGVLAAGAAALGLAATPAQAKTKLLFCSFVTPKHVINHGALVPWLKDIQKATEGRVSIRIVQACHMGPPPLQMVMVQKGTADGAYVFNAFLRKLVPSTQISIHPQMAETGVGRAVALWRMYQKFFKDKANYKDLEMVGYFGAPDGSWFSMSDTPLLSMASLKTIKTWTLPSVPAQALKLSGANIVPGPAVRIYPIVSKGVVDAFVGLTYGDLHAFKIDKYAKSGTVIPGGWFGASFSTFWNKKKWDTIPEKDQKIIWSLSGEKLARRSIAWDMLKEEKRRLFVKTRKVHTMPEAEMVKLRAAWAPLYADWIESINAMGVDGKAAMAYYKSQTAAVDAEVEKQLAGK